MTQNNTGIDSELPSMAKLIKSTILAIAIAAILLITVVLPAEYGIDPTGIGRLIGLVKMGEIKVSLAREATLEKNAQVNTDADVQENQKTEVALGEKISEAEVDFKSDKISLTLKPNEGKEIKLTMTEGSTVNYNWYTDGGKANFDAHADSKQLKIKYHSYEKGKLEKREGIMEAAFDGNHGWFWRNRTSKTMKVTLEVNGNYSDALQF